MIIENFFIFELLCIKIFLILNSLDVHKFRKLSTNNRRVIRKEMSFEFWHKIKWRKNYSEFKHWTNLDQQLISSCAILWELLLSVFVQLPICIFVYRVSVNKPALVFPLPILCSADCSLKLVQVYISLR